VSGRAVARPSLGRVTYLGANALVLLFLLGPLFVVAVFAVNPTPFIQFPPVGVTTRWFEKFFASAEFMNSLVLSLQVAVATVVLAMLLGASAALAIARGNLPGARVLTAIFLAPLMLPAILTGLALFQLVLSLGLGRPVWALVMGHTLVAVPYVIRTTLAVLADFDRRIEEGAASLGASPARVFAEVTLPLIRPGIIAGGIFAFIVSFDQFPISLFLVTPNRETLPIVMFNYMKFDLDGTIAAASMVSILLALTVVLAIDRLVGLRATMKI
jgi:putative spermidine/putrescine transport system permease protein